MSPRLFDALATLLAVGLALTLWGPVILAWVRGGREAVRAFREELHSD